MRSAVADGHTNARKEGTLLETQSCLRVNITKTDLDQD